MMKHEQPDTSRYTDLLDQPGDSSQTKLVHNLASLYSVQLPSVLSWAEIEQKHRERHQAQKKETGMQKTAATTKKTRLIGILPLRPSRRLGIASVLAALIIVALTAAALITIPPGLRTLLNDNLITQHVLQADQFSTIQQSQTVGGATVQLEVGYADSNLLVVGYSISAPNTDDTSVHFTATTQQGFKLSEFDAEEEFVAPKATNAAFYDAFNTSDIMSPPQRLTIQLSGPVTQGNELQARLGHLKTLGNVSFTISVPFHMGKVLTPHQSVTVNGQTATLERVVITPTLTSIVVSGLATPNGFSLDPTLDIQNHSYDLMSSGTDDTQPNGTWVFNYAYNLYNSSSTWKLTIRQRNISNQSVLTTWTFRFPVH